ncbi:pantoate--beta-alanine ligase [Demequina sp. SYSU T00068]|uniref:pantoate--beta-alanine ligase n=1 Tax=Demequina lignilytica TaxID=3051663 RepID=UPI00260AE27F|nr:pantoate--beta-alanine ligase [Demequina sp. SYSU T00068]MDN4490618.1 pantoate--beta-alanine ligase [Demequina sp. SYSU T00068]
MRIVHTARELRGLASRPSRRSGDRASRAVVMTMGALHEGHLALVRAAREAADEVVVTIFVNPLQFEDDEDLERYPRTLEADCALLEPLGVDVVFAPSLDEVYPGGPPVVTVHAGAIGDVLEGAHRPGHFDGVLTVVTKLLNLTQPDLAFFGQKDAQQVIAVRALVRDLSIATRIVPVPTVRDADGLALSSRNVFLSPVERTRALVLHRALQAADGAARAGRDLETVLAAGRHTLSEVPQVEVDYLAALDPVTAEELTPGYVGEAVVAVAAQVGATRLIDNVVTRIGPVLPEAPAEA